MQNFDQKKPVQQSTESMVKSVDGKYLKKNTLKKVIALLSAVVMLLTMNSLRLDAQTLEHKAMCGLAEHEHSEACYDAEGQLICGMEAHVHTDACYQQSPSSSVGTSIDEFVNIDSQVNLASPMSSISEDGALSIDAPAADQQAQEAQEEDNLAFTNVDAAVGETEADLGQDADDSGVSGLEAVYDTVDGSEGGATDGSADDAADDMTDGTADGSASENVDAVQYVFDMNGSVTFLSDVLNAVGAQSGEIGIIGEIEGDTLILEGGHTVAEPVEGVPGEYVIKAVRDFGQIILGVEINGNIIEIELRNGVAQPEASSDAETESEPEQVGEENVAENAQNESTNEIINNEPEITETEEKQTEVGGNETEVGNDAQADAGDEAVAGDDAQTNNDETEADAQTEGDENETGDDAQTEGDENETEGDDAQTEGGESETGDDAQTEGDENETGDDAQTEGGESENEGDAQTEGDESETGDDAQTEGDENETEGGESEGDEPEAAAPAAVAQRTTLDFTNYIATDEHTVYLYDAAMVAVLVNVDEIDAADGVEVIADTSDAQADTDEQADTDAQVEAEEPVVADANAALIITGDGEYEIGGAVYEVVGLTLPGNVVSNEAQNVTISTSNEEATLLNVEPVFEETAKDYADIFSLIQQAESEPKQLSSIASVLFGVAYAEESEMRELQMKLFNISLQDVQTGEEVEPGTEVHVQTSFDAIEGEDFTLYHIVDGRAVPMANAVARDEEGRAIGFDFYVDSLSPFALVYYTVTTATGETYTGYSFKTEERALNAQSILETLGIQAIATGISCADEGVVIDGLDIALPEDFTAPIAISVNSELDIYEITLLPGDALEAAAGDYRVALDLSASGLDENRAYRVDIAQKPATEEKVAAVEAALSEELEGGVRKVARVSDLEIVDISIVDIATGEAVEPAGPVGVTLTRDGGAVPTVVHFKDDQTTELLEVGEDGSFTTESFSEFTGSYTVDFEYIDSETAEKTTWSWPGRGAYKISDIMAEIGATGEISDVSLERTVDVGGAENALYLSDDKAELISDVAFQDTFELTVKTAQTVQAEAVEDGAAGEVTVERTYVLVVTDAVGDHCKVTIHFYEEDGTTQVDSPSINGTYYYLVILNTNEQGKYALSNDPVSLTNGSTMPFYAPFTDMNGGNQNYNIGTIQTVCLVSKPDGSKPGFNEAINPSPYNGVTSINTGNGVLDGYLLTATANGTDYNIKATKMPSYKVTSSFVDASGNEVSKALHNSYYLVVKTSDNKYYVETYAPSKIFEINQFFATPNGEGTGANPVPYTNETVISEVYLVDKANASTVANAIGSEVTKITSGSVEVYNLGQTTAGSQTTLTFTKNDTDVYTSTIMFFNEGAEVIEAAGDIGMHVNANDSDTRLEVPSLSKNYYVLATLLDKATDALAGWAINPVSLNGHAETSTLFTTFTPCDATGEPVANGTPIAYSTLDDFRYDVVTRLFHTDSATPPTSYKELVVDKLNNASDIAENGYEYVGNWNPDATHNEIHLKEASPKTYAVRVRFKSSDISRLDPLMDNDNYYVNVVVTHASGNDTTSFQYAKLSVSDFTSLEEVDDEGYLYKEFVFDHWRKIDSGCPEKKDSDSNPKFTGNEQNIRVELIKTQSNVNNYDYTSTYMADQTKKYAEGESAGAYKVHYDTRWTNPQGTMSKFHETGTDPVKCYDVIDLILPDATSEYDYATILGPNYGFGIVADHLFQNNDLQTNFAVNHYTGHGDYVTPDLSNSPGTIVIGEFNRNTDVMTQNHVGYAVPQSSNDPEDVKAGSLYLGSNIAKPLAVYVDDNSGAVYDTYGGSPLIYAREKAYVVKQDGANLQSQIVNPGIQYGVSMSRTLAGKEANYTPEIDNAGKATVNTKGFPRNATIYIDADALVASNIKHQDDVNGPLHVLEELDIIKWPDQMLIFNFKNTKNVRLKQFDVKYPKADGTEGYDKEFNSTTTTGQSEQNNDMDGLSRHLVWNFASCTGRVELNSIGGICLQPNYGSETQISGTSGGWLVSNGYVYNNNAEWHNFFGEVPDSTEVTLQLLKTVDDKVPGTDEIFDFELSEYKVGASEPTSLGTQQNTRSSVRFVIKDEEGTPEAERKLTEGWHVYKIVEKKQRSSMPAANTNSYFYDDTTYYAAVRVTQVGTGRITSAPLYFKGFDPAQFDSISVSGAGIPAALSEPLASATFKNELKKDGLTLKKTVEGTDVSKVPFTFKIELWKVETGSTSALDEAAKDYTVTGLPGVTKITLTPNTAKTLSEGTLDLKNGQSATITGIVLGAHYRITETHVNGNTITAGGTVGGYTRKSEEPKTGTVVGGGVKEEFVNVYHASGNTTLHAHKKLKNPGVVTLPKDAYGFELYRVGGEKVVDTSTTPAKEIFYNDDHGNVTFPQLSFTEADMEGATLSASNNGKRTKTIMYRVHEVDGKVAGFPYDQFINDSDKYISVVLTDNGDGTITALTSPANATAEFNNEKGVEVQLEGYKKLVGRDMKGGEVFRFVARELPEGKTDWDSEAVTVATATLMGARDGEATKFTFSPIKYTGAGVHTYRIYEVIPSVQSDLVYDNHYYVATVTVSADDNGDLSVASPVYSDGETTTFTNICDESVSVEKVWSNGNEHHASDSVQVVLFKAVGGNVDQQPAANTTVNTVGGEAVGYPEGGKTIDLPSADYLPSGAERVNGTEVLLSIENGWKYTWKNLPKMQKVDGTWKYVTFYPVEVWSSAVVTGTTYEKKVNNERVYQVTIENTVPQSGALKLTKVVTVNGHEATNATEGGYVDGSYVFSIVGPTQEQDQITKYVLAEVRASNNGNAPFGEAFKYYISDYNYGNNAIDWYNNQSNSNLSLKTYEKYGNSVVVDGLEPGNYEITELTPTNGTTLVNAVSGDNTSTTPTGAVSVYVHVTGGRTAEADLLADAQATFTNDRQTGSLKLKKVFELNNINIQKDPVAAFSIVGPMETDLAKRINNTVWFEYDVNDKTIWVCFNGDWYQNDGSCNFFVDGGYWLIPNLTPGTYNITETQSYVEETEDYELNLTGISVTGEDCTSDVVVKTATLVVPAEGTATVPSAVFTNKVEEASTEIKVQKKWLDSDGVTELAPWNGAASVVISVSRHVEQKKPVSTDVNITGWSGESVYDEDLTFVEPMTITSGGRRLTVAPVEPGGTTYTVTNTAYGGDNWSIVIKGLEKSYVNTELNKKYDYSYTIKELSVIDAQGNILSGYTTTYDLSGEWEGDAYSYDGKLLFQDSNGTVHEIGHYDNKNNMSAGGEEIPYTGEPGPYMGIGFVADGGTAYIKNRKIENASLNLRKAVQISTSVQGKELTKTDGTYTFTVMGPLTAEEVASAGIPEADSDKTYNITITTSSGAMSSATVKKPDGTDISSTAFNVTDGVTLTGLKPGTYLITETAMTLSTPVNNAEMYLREITMDPENPGSSWDARSKTARVVIGAGERSTVQTVYTNQLEPNVPVLEKQVTDFNDSTKKPDASFILEDPCNKSADYDIGDKVPYRITTFMPTNVYRSKNTYYYEIEDTMTHLTYVGQSGALMNDENYTGTGRMYAFIKKDEAGVGEVGDWYDVSNWFSVNVGNYSGGKQTITVYPTDGHDLKNVNTGKKLANWGSANTHGDSMPFKEPTFESNTPTGFDNDDIRYLQFRYRAELMDDANIGPAVGNPNTAVLYYEVEHDEDHKTNEDTNIVYTYRLKVNKTDGTNALDGAQFQLFKKYLTTDSEFLPSDAPVGRDMGSGFTFHGLDNAVTTLDFTNASSASSYSGHYYLVNETSATAGDSEFIWNGIDDGYYILVETHAPQGYRPLGEPLLFQIETQVRHDIPGFTSGVIKCFPENYKAEYFTSSQLSETVVEYVAGIPNTPYPGIRIEKIDEMTRGTGTVKHLQGAEFTIKKWNGKDYYPYTPVDMTNTEYHVANSTATTDDNGVAVFPKLEPGEYKIEETVVPNGYVKLVSNDIYFNVEYESDGKQKITRYKTPMTTKTKENGGVVEVSRDSTDIVSESYDKTIGVSFTARTDSEEAIFTVGNVPGVALPSTGGPGTALIYGAGAGLMLIAILGLVLTNRKRGRGAGIE